MSKAKELATQVRNLYFDMISVGDTQQLLLDLADAVLSEPEPFKGWIECTSTFYDNDRVVLINIRDISSIFIINDPKDHALNALTGICLRRAEEVYNVKESYDSIKQKIRGAS